MNIPGSGSNASRTFFAAATWHSALHSSTSRVIRASGGESSAGVPDQKLRQSAPNAPAAERHSVRNTNRRCRSSAGAESKLGWGLGGGGGGGGGRTEPRSRPRTASASVPPLLFPRRVSGGSRPASRQRRRNPARRGSRRRLRAGGARTRWCCNRGTWLRDRLQYLHL